MPPKKNLFVDTSTSSRSARSKKREHDPNPSGDSPVKKRETRNDASNRILLVGFTAAEVQKHKLLIKDDEWTIDETLSDSITHLVIKNMGGLKNSQQLLPIYWAALKDIYLLKPSFIPHPPGTRRKSLGNGTPLENERDHEFSQTESGANDKAKAEFPSMAEVLTIRDFARNRKTRGSTPIMGSEPFKKVAIVAGRSKDSKQRKEDLKLVLQAGGATVIEDTVLKTWKAKRMKDANIERPSMVIIVNGEVNVKGLGLDDDTIRDLLKGRTPLFYEEFISHILQHTMIINLEDLLLQSFVFVHENMKGVDPDGKVQARVMGDEVSDDDEEEEDRRTLAARRANSRVSSTVRTASASARAKGKKKGKRDEEEDEEEEIEVDEEEPPKRTRGRPKRESKKSKEEEKKDEETPKAPKAVRGDRAKKAEEEQGMDEEDVDPELENGNADDLLGDFEREILERRRGGTRVERSEEEERELRQMRDDRGDREEEQPVTPEPIVFSQPASQPQIVIPDELRKALETAWKEDGGKSDDLEDMENLREEKNNERGRGKKKTEGEEERLRGDEPASELGFPMSAVPAMEDELKNSEACHPLGAQHLYFNMMTAQEIEDHFTSPRLDWQGFIVDTKQRMPWIKKGKGLRPANAAQASSIQRHVIDLFYNFYHELDDEVTITSLLAEVNSSDAMEMYESEYEESTSRRPPIDMMIKMLHEFAVKRHAEDLRVPERACSALKNALPVIVPSSEYGRHFWLTVLAGGSHGIKGRAFQVVEEMAKRCKNFIFKSVISNLYHRSVIEFVVYYCEVDLLCAQSVVVDYGKTMDETLESQQSMKSTRGRKKKRNPLEKFPLVLLLVMELDEDPKKGLSEAAVLVVQKLMELVAGMKRAGAWSYAETLQRALLCLLEAARWHCAQAATTALTGAERRRMKAAEKEGKTTQNGEKVTVELQQNVQRACRWIMKKGVKRPELREILPLGWLEDIVDTLE
ncbi:hypothetical protein PRIPAC_94023 [Pristionchus pacificus]|nr:hypothetical protein PRIPAC_94023 [Pristionchus pacificus]